MREELPLDSLGLYPALLGLPSQLRAAGEIAVAEARAPRLVVLAGMGGSGLACEVVAAFLLEEGSVAPVVVQSYELPKFADEQSLVVCVSFSGNTEETLEVARKALNAGCKVVGVASGGALKEFCEQEGLLFVPVDASIPQPRAAIGALFAAVASVLVAHRCWPGPLTRLEEASSWLSEHLDLLIKKGFELGREMAGGIVLAYGAKPLSWLAALRLKNQINENVKSPAFWNYYPELCHNELVGFGQLGDITRQLFYVVEFCGSSDHPRQSLRRAFVEGVIREAAAKHFVIEASSEDPLTQLFEHFVVADAMSLAMAAELRIDPGPVPILDELKAFLRKGE